MEARGHPTSLVLLEGGLSQAHREFAVSKPANTVTPNLGDIVIVWNSLEAKEAQTTDWWMAEVIAIEQESKQTRTPLLVQVSCLDTGIIQWVDVERVQSLCLPIHSPLSMIGAH